VSVEVFFNNDSTLTACADTAYKTTGNTKLLWSERNKSIMCVCENRALFNSND